MLDRGRGKAILPTNHPRLLGCTSMPGPPRRRAMSTTPTPPSPRAPSSEAVRQRRLWATLRSRCAPQGPFPGPKAADPRWPCPPPFCPCPAADRAIFVLNCLPVDGNGTCWDEIASNLPGIRRPSPSFYTSVQLAPVAGRVKPISITLPCRVPLVCHLCHCSHDDPLWPGPSPPLSLAQAPTNPADSIHAPL